VGTAIPLTPGATRLPEEYGPLPTVTPYVAPTSEPGQFAAPDLGITLQLPDGWTTQPGEDTSTVSWFYAPDQSVIGVLFHDVMPEGQTLAQVTADVAQATSQGLTQTAAISDGAIVLANGQEAWQNIYEGTREDGLRLKVGLTAATSGGRLFVLMVFSSVEGYDGASAAIETLVQGLQIHQPALYGISRSEALVLAGGESTNPREYDPATTHGSGDKMVFSGLVSFDPGLHLVPELAESWQASDDGTVYTFTLRANARFHNGRPVTAQDVVYSWERAAAPEQKSDTVLSYLGDIVGVKEMNAGQATHIAGLKVVDDHTLQVTIDAPKPYFLLKLTYPTAFVLDRANVESGTEWYRTPNGTGPYRLARWETMNLKLYERNDGYYLDPPAIRYVVVKIYQGVALRLYESGEIDVAGVGSSDVPRVLDPNDPLHPDVHSAVNLCTGYITLDISKPPFDDLKVRQAFSMAFNRQQFLDVVMHGIGLPAQGLFPPGLPGYNADLRGLPYDPVQARQLLAESRYGGPQGLPPIVYTDGGYGSDIGADVAALAQMWQETLGVTITVENLEPDRYLDEIYAGHHGQIFSVGWCADYPDPENFADVLFHTGSQQNRGNYSNPQVDALLEQARVEPDVARRIQLYQQAEQMIVDDAPVIFTTHSISYVVVKPRILGYALTPIDIPLERYLQIDASK
jgi:oligopeptide transport system substrate-binding protein